PVERTGRSQGEKAIGEFRHDIGQHVVVDASDHGDFGALAIELFHEFLDRLADDFLLGGRWRVLVHALAKDVLVVVEAVARAGRQQLGIAVADSMRERVVILPRLALFVGRQQALKIDDFPHHDVFPLAQWRAGRTHHIGLRFASPYDAGTGRGWVDAAAYRGTPGTGRAAADLRRRGHFLPAAADPGRSGPG